MNIAIFVIRNNNRKFLIPSLMFSKCWVGISIGKKKNKTNKNYNYINVLWTGFIWLREEANIGLL
jgi:hypothetical protein